MFAFAEHKKILQILVYAIFYSMVAAPAPPVDMAVAVRRAPHPFDDPDGDDIEEPDDFAEPAFESESEADAVDSVPAIKVARHEVNISRTRQQATYRY